MDKNLCIFGDSITQGYSDDEAGGWASRLFAYAVKKDPDWGVFPLGIAGDTTAGVLERFENETPPRGGEYLVFAIGINDALTYHDGRPPFISEEKFEQQVATILKRAKTNAEKVLFVGLTRVDESKTNPLADSSSGECYENGRIDQFDAIIERVSAEHDVPYLPMKDVMTIHELPDGLHPNARGHELMFERIKKFLEDNGVL